MRFVTFETGGAARAGVLQGDGSGAGDTVLDLAHQAMRDALAGAAPQVLALLRAGLAGVAERLRQAGRPAEAVMPLASVRLLPSLPDPGHIYGAAHNYRDALEERGMAAPAEPVLFDKVPETLVGPNAPVVLPEGIGDVTYEAEIAAVIGSVADRVTPVNALAHVAAYGVFNDVSASGLVRADGHFRRGKNLPSFGPFGPYLATADEIPDPHALRIGLSVDGVTLQDSSTSRMLFGVAELVSILSHRQPLRPGDVIATGTPAGVAPNRKPPTWLRPGQTMIAWVEGLGQLRNPVIAGPAFHG